MPLKINNTVLVCLHHKTAKKKIVSFINLRKIKEQYVLSYILQYGILYKMDSDPDPDF